MVQLGFVLICDVQINESLIRERHQIPKLEEVLPELNNAKYFSKIDLWEGYHQIQLDLSSRHVTAFITNEGTFQSKRLVYGAKLAFGNFRKIIEQTIAGCPGTNGFLMTFLFGHHQ